MKEAAEEGQAKLKGAFQHVTQGRPRFVTDTFFEKKKPNKTTDCCVLITRVANSHRNHQVTSCLGRADGHARSGSVQRTVITHLSHTAIPNDRNRATEWKVDIL